MCVMFMSRRDRMMSVFPKLFCYWIQFNENSNRFLTDLDKANSDYMEKQCSEQLRRLRRVRQLVVLPYHVSGHSIIRTVNRGRHTNATERRLVEKRWAVQHLHSVSAWAQNILFFGDVPRGVLGPGNKGQDFIVSIRNKSCIWNLVPLTLCELLKLHAKFYTNFSELSVHQILRGVLSHPSGEKVLHS